MSVNDFLNKHGWSMRGSVAQDGSARRYFRVEKDSSTAILMEVMGDTPGHRIEDFIAIGSWLNDIGLNAPKIYEAQNNLLLLEDFDDLSFKDALVGGEDAGTLYGLASDVLKHLNTNDCPLSLPNYYDSHVHMGHRRMIDWFVPAQRKLKNPDGLAEEYLKIWAEIEAGLAPCAKGFMHIDFHVQNLMWLPQESGVKRCGILDFQGGMVGPAAYDLGNLLEDARINVSPDIRKSILAGYDEEFLAHYRVLTTQFHCRVIGQFIKMALQTGKGEYLECIPRVGKYIDEALQDPLLKPLNEFLCDLKLDFMDIKMLNADEIKGYIRPDAY